MQTNMRCLSILLLCFPLLAHACRPKRDAYGHIKRSKKAVSVFRATVRCPVTGEVGKRCPGYVVDHVVPLACCGADSVENMHWQTKAAAKVKDRWERKRCGSAD